MKKLFLAFLTILSLTFIGCVYSSREKLEFEDEKALHSETYERSFNDEATASDIGDMVEKGLMSGKKKDVAKAYVLKRDERNRIRGNTTDKVINEIVNGTSSYWTTENSNKNAMIASTQRDYMAGAVSEDISRRQLLPRDIIEAHDEGKIHFHNFIVA